MHRSFRKGSKALRESTRQCRERKPIRTTTRLTSSIRRWRMARPPQEELHPLKPATAGQAQTLFGTPIIPAARDTNGVHRTPVRPGGVRPRSAAALAKPAGANTLNQEQQFRTAEKSDRTRSFHSAGQRKVAPSMRRSATRASTQTQTGHFFCRLHFHRLPPETKARPPQISRRWLIYTLTLTG